MNRSLSSSKVPVWQKFNPSERRRRRAIRSAKRATYTRPYFYDSDEIKLDFVRGLIVVRRDGAEIAAYSASEAPDYVFGRAKAELRLRDEMIDALFPPDARDETVLDLDADFEAAYGMTVRAKEMELEE